ncbi:MAG TPA: pyridoxamine 5'-phosphate oxidase [Phycisphaerales bacterium]|nr:pyridoxamine 5'-phosphate oxidase [Phycisphaerales bacterium]
MNSFDFERPPSEPMTALHAWMDEATRTSLPNPNAMTLATVDPDGSPSARIVLLRGLDERGAVFFTNRESRKGLALETNKVAALVFHWDCLERQIRIEGTVEHVSEEESDTYWKSRPRGSQLAARASRQSRPIEDRESFEAACRAEEARFEGREVERPAHWGGYRVALKKIEFWQGMNSRMHDRITYRFEAGDWHLERLSP